MTINIREELIKQKKIATIWGVSDVFAVRNDLTEDQAWEVLQRIDRKADMSVGVTWETVEIYCDEMFPLSADKEE